ncbi:MAG: hypothetical protein NT091_03415, partial [Candidatus Falkowbacteria bacterium]|nr:hypothetical protein [Candidatus Falkowbacteria bacterium]
CSLVLTYFYNSAKIRSCIRIATKRTISNRSGCKVNFGGIGTTSMGISCSDSVANAAPLPAKISCLPA